MRFVHEKHPGCGVRLGYCLNVHPAEDLTGVLVGLSEVAAPLAKRLCPEGPFGVGLYLPRGAARELCEQPAAMTALAELLSVSGLDPFTFNAFPIERFHRPGLKAAVFEPAWDQTARLEYTLDVARVALALDRRLKRSTSAAGRHLSISTHAGAHASVLRGDPGRRARIERGLGAGIRALDGLREPGDPRLLLAIEPEPRSSANDSVEWARAVPAWSRAAGLAPAAGPESGAFGLCLDACHAAVEFEAPEDAAQRARSVRRPLAKFQFTSALELPEPGRDPLGRERLLALAEPVYLHQTSALSGDGTVLGVDDLPDLPGAFERDPVWLQARLWRCHFHVPLGQSGCFPDSGGLGTTQAHADQLLAVLLSQPQLWGLAELHLELETYTWSVLPDAPRGPEGLVERLAAEYQHALECLRSSGWQRA